MRKISTILVINVLFIIMLTGCGNKKTEDIIETKTMEKSTAVITEQPDVLLQIEEVTKTSICLTLTNHTEETIVHGAPYILEQYIDGEWYVYPETEPEEGVERTWTCEAYETKSQETSTISHSWFNPYGKLQNGKYRYIKDIWLDVRGKNEVLLSVEFELDS